jgi:oxalate decarboxylase
MEKQLRNSYENVPQPIRDDGAGAMDVGYVPFAMGHYIQNTGSQSLWFLEMFRSNRFADVSLNQWMALTPKELIQDHLHVHPFRD